MESIINAHPPTFSYGVLGCSMYQNASSIICCIANGDNNSAETALYSVFMGAVRTLREECNTDIDTWIVGNQIANATKE